MVFDCPADAGTLIVVRSSCGGIIGGHTLAALELEFLRSSCEHTLAGLELEFSHCKPCPLVPRILIPP